MSSTFFGLELSRRALEAQQTALNTTGHNISNANTPGYTRQTANLTATTPETLNTMGHNVSVGTGVKVNTIGRARDAFVDRQYRWESSQQQYWAAREDSLQKVEGLLNEPSDYSLSSDMNQFWTSWSDLSKNPENMGARSVLSERTMTLTDSFHRISQQINDMQKDMNETVKVQVHQINVYGNQIKALNDQIKRAEVAGDSPNDLRDKRDALVDELSQIASVRVVETKDTKFTDRNVNNYKVIIGDEAVGDANILVNDSLVHHLIDPPPERPEGSSMDSFARIAWENTPAIPVELGVKQGKLQANIEMRDEYLTQFRTQFDDLAKGIGTGVNALHQQGQGLIPADVDSVTGEPIGLNFFVNSQTNNATNITAANISLNSVLGQDVEKIATGKFDLDVMTKKPIVTTVAVGDGSVAQDISSLAGGWAVLKNMIDNGIFGKDIDGNNLKPVPASSFGDFYGANVAQMGVDVQEATRMKEGEDVLVTQIGNQRESYSGVSLDEEMTNLVAFQKSYAAAARMVTMMDDMLNTIVNGMGITR